MRNPGITFAAVLAFGCSSTPTTGEGPFGGTPNGGGTYADTQPKCDGSRAGIPADYPALGEGCNAHFTWIWADDPLVGLIRRDEGSARGLRAMPQPIRPGFHDMGAMFGTEAERGASVWLFLPSLQPGLYRLEDGASGITKSAFLSSYDR
jgi:hypothetical protein